MHGFFFLKNIRLAGAVFLTLPLAIFFSMIGLYATGETLNAMTLGGLALAVGRLMDDSIVVLENTGRHLEGGLPADEASAKGAGEVVTPLLAASMITLAIFVPVFFLTGMSRFLFGPLAKSVSFAIVGSFCAAMTVIPVFTAHILKYRTVTTAPAGAEGWFLQLCASYEKGLDWVLARRRKVLAGALLLFGFSWLFFFNLGSELFPASDTGHIRVLARGPSGTRVEKTEEALIKIEEVIRQTIPAGTIETLITNIGVLNDWPAAYTPNSGPQDAFIELQLTQRRSSGSGEYARALREVLNKRFTDFEFAFETQGMMTAALTEGLPSPINVQIEGNDLEVSHRLAKEVLARMKKIEGLADVRIQQRLDYPQIKVVLDRKKAEAMRVSAADVVKNIVTATNSSINFDPSFWFDHQNRNHYFMGAQYPEEILNSLEILKEIPVTSDSQERVFPLKEVAFFEKGEAPSEINHLNINRVMDIYANVEGRDIGSAAAAVEEVIKDLKTPEGYRIAVRGEVAQMKKSFANLGGGFLLALFLVYLTLAALFRSFRDPLIILVSVPLGLIGVWLLLWLTGTTLNIQSGIGTIFMMSVAVANGILLVEFAHRARERGLSAARAVREAGHLRLRPVLMISLAAILGLVPMALGLGRGTEANVPLALAVIGGLSVSTVMTLFVVPALYLVVHGKEKK